MLEELPFIKWKCIAVTFSDPNNLIHVVIKTISGTYERVHFDSGFVMYSNMVDMVHPSSELFPR